MSRRRDTGRRDPAGQPARRLIAVVVLLAAAFAAGWWASARARPFTSTAFQTPRQQPRTTALPPAASARRPDPPAPSRQAPADAGEPLPEPATRHPRATFPEPPPDAPRVAIVFDDAGGSLDDVERVIAIGRPVAVAVLPGLRYSAEVSRRARAAGLEVLLHLPLEPEDSTKALGPGGITAAMSSDEVRAAVRAGLDAVPGAIGINNHMGSKGTADRRVMRVVLETAKDAGVFYLDSVTTPHSVAPAIARELGVRTAARAVFLDNEDEDGSIRRQIARLIALARQRGEAIAIGHAHRLTPTVIAAALDEFDRAGVVLVPLSRLVK